MPVTWGEAVSNYRSTSIESTEPRGFCVCRYRTTEHEGWRYLATYTGEPHKPYIGIIDVQDDYDADAKKAAVRELKAACAAWWDAAATAENAPG